MAEGPRVLLIEDDEAIRYVVSEALADDGCQVRAVGGGREALALLADWRPDVILLDLMLPDMDGWAFRAAQREQGRGADIPLVLCTASRQASIAAADLGAAAILAKPFDLPDLLAAVERAAGRG
ncbi:MAG TPA: response regulator [Thermomicrobiales bacterium]|nr:response regulator [Thermomicrobiales bacterium]